MVVLRECAEDIDRDRESRFVICGGCVSYALLSLLVFRLYGFGEVREDGGFRRQIFE